MLTLSLQTMEIASLVVLTTTVATWLLPAADDVSNDVSDDAWNTSSKYIVTTEAARNSSVKQPLKYYRVSDPLLVYGFFIVVICAPWFLDSLVPICFRNVIIVLNQLRRNNWTWLEHTLRRGDMTALPNKHSRECQVATEEEDDQQTPVKGDIKKEMWTAGYTSTAGGRWRA